MLECMWSWEAMELWTYMVSGWGVIKGDPSLTHLPDCADSIHTSAWSGCPPIARLMMIELVCIVYMCIDVLMCFLVHYSQYPFVPTHSFLVLSHRNRFWVQVVVVRLDLNTVIHGGMSIDIHGGIFTDISEPQKIGLWLGASVTYPPGFLVSSWLDLDSLVGQYLRVFMRS
jgi:hypothetical protein